MTALEKAIEAVLACDAECDDHWNRSVGQVIHDRDTAAALARAVLMAVREPGQSIVDRGTAQINYDCPVPADAPADDDYSDDVRRFFTAMIDAILSEGQP